MRRWFAISGLCHGGLLAALIVWPRTETPPRAAPVVFECEGVAESAPEIAPREPDPVDAVLERSPEEWCPDFREVDAVLAEEFAEPDRIPEVSREDPPQLNVRLRRPLRRQCPTAIAPPAPKPRAKSGISRAPSLRGKDTQIPYPRRARRRGRRRALPAREPPGLGSA